MNYSEQEYRLAREVVYLHSLWHRGPPNKNPNLSSCPPIANPNFSSPHLPTRDPSFYPRPFISNPNPYSYPNPNPNPSLYYHNYNYNYNYPSSHLTPEGSNKKQKLDSPLENEWPCDPASVPGQSSPHTWTPFEQSVQLATLSPCTDARAALISMQLPAVQSCKGFFSRDSDSESECESGSENDNVDEFFKGLFENDVGLRVCYEKDHENGEFYCLVCEGRRGGHKGKGKMYRGCAALVQHANAVCKVGRLAAHRAFARAICQVLGWDPQRLPSIVLLPGSVMKADHSEDKRETGVNLNPNPTSDSLENEEHTGSTTFLDMNPPSTSAETLAMAQLPLPISSQSDYLDRADDIQCRAIRATKNFFLAIKEDYRCVSDNEPGCKSESNFEVKSHMDDFFDGMFGKNSELKEYYRNNYEKGDFYCFICEAKDDYKGKGMRYKSGLALVQHANNISKTGCSDTHEALAKAVCRVLEWDAANVPDTSVCSPQVLFEAGVSGTKEIPKREDSNKEDNSETNVKEDPKGVVVKMVDMTGDKEELTGTTSEETINPVKPSGSIVEEKKESTSFAA